MKALTSIHTYFPLLYILSCALISSVWYQLVDYKPYVILFVFVFNTFVFKYHRHKRLVKSLLDRSLWRAGAFANYAIVASFVHQMLFKEHLVDERINIVISVIYSLMMLVYREKTNDFRIGINLVFLFAPISGVWQVNLYAFTVLVITQLFIQFSCCKPQDLVKDVLAMSPAISLFPYLRTHDICIVFGILHVYGEYRHRFVETNKSFKELDELIDDI